MSVRVAVIVGMTRVVGVFVLFVFAVIVMVVV